MVVAGVANDNELTTVPRLPSWRAPPPLALAVLPQEVMGIAVPEGVDRLLHPQSLATHGEER